MTSRHSIANSPTAVFDTQSGNDSTILHNSPASNAIRKQCWFATVPLIVYLKSVAFFESFVEGRGEPSRLFEEDVPDEPHPVALLARRMTYLPCVFDEIVHGFNILLSKETIVIKDGSNGSTRWFVGFTDAATGLPVAWHTPIGVLYDLHGYSVPLKLNMYLTTRPTTNPYPFLTQPYFFSSDGAEIRSAYHSALKASDWLRWRQSCRRVNALPRADQAMMWECVSKQAVVLKEPPVASQPFRRYRNQWWRIASTLLASPDTQLEIQWANYFTQIVAGRAHSAFTLPPSGALQSFGYIPCRIYVDTKGPGKLIAPPALKNISQDVAESNNNLERTLTTIADIVPEATCTMLCHGIVVPASTPLLWLSHHMCYGDTVIHLVCASSM